jgi:hypothetical protein
LAKKKLELTPDSKTEVTNRNDKVKQQRHNGILPAVQCDAKKNKVSNSRMKYYMTRTPSTTELLKSLLVSCSDAAEWIVDGAKFDGACKRELFF